MDLFRKDGHLSDAGFAALVDGKLDEVQRLEAAEHLGFCDTCMLQYCELLTPDVMLAPPEPLAQPVLRRRRQKALRTIWGKTAMVAAAAVLAVGVWMMGALGLPYAAQNSLPDAPAPAAVPQADQAAAEEAAIENPLSVVLNKTGAALTGWFAWYPQADDTAQPQQTAPVSTAQDKAEDVFKKPAMPQPHQNEQDASSPESSCESQAA